jgi:hypothetical protein
MSGAFSGDGQPAPVTDASDKWLLDGSPWNTLRSCHFVQACLAGWLVESGCLEPAKCFSSQLNFDSSWCFHGALLLTLVSRVPYPTCFFGDKKNLGRVTLHKTGIDMENHGKPTICIFHGIHHQLQGHHHQEHVAIFWTRYSDESLWIFCGI